MVSDLNNYVVKRPCPKDPFGGRNEFRVMNSHPELGSGSMLKAADFCRRTIKGKND